MRTVLVLLTLSVAAPAADWPQFLGPDRNGQADASEAKVPDAISGDLRPLWDKPLGSGFAGPAVAGKRVIVFHRKGDEVLIEALDAATGKELWSFSSPTDYQDSFGFDNGPRATPTIAGNRVFAHGADGKVHALELDSGKKLWSYDTVAELQSPQGYFGRAGAPIVIGENVILTPGGTGDGKPAGVIALNAATGKLVWQNVQDEAGYASPVRFGPPEKPGLLCWMRNEFWALDPASGDIIAHTSLRASMDASVNAATPIPIGNGRYFTSAGYGVGGAIWAIEPKPDLSKPVSSLTDLMDCHYSTPVYSNGHLYGFHGRQETGQNLRCVDLAAGKVKWESHSIPGGHVILVGDKVLAVTEQGELWVVKATPDKFDQESVIQILRSGHRSPPAFANGILYARDGHKLVAVKLVE